MAKSEKIVVSKELMKLAEEKGYTFEQINKGYIEVKDTNILNGATHIKAITDIEELKKFNTDQEVVEYLKSKKSIKFIEDLPDCLSENDKQYFLDTPENKSLIKSAIQQKYNIKWEKTLQVVNRQKLLDYVNSHSSESGLTENQLYSLIKTIKVVTNYRYRDSETVFEVLGSNEYYCTYPFLKKAIESVLETKPEEDLTSEYVVYTT